jgi:hypothetical protein
MAKQRRSNDWGFPRWRAYGTDREPAAQRMCDRHGCGGVGDRPAPKAPNSAERWWFCEAHAAEYNRNWNYFAGLGAEEAATRAAEDDRDRDGYSSSRFWGWSSEDTADAAEREALRTLGLDADAGEEAIKIAYRRLAKQHHPDVNQGEGSVDRFHEVQAAYDLLQRTAARRQSDS